MYLFCPKTDANLADFDSNRIEKNEIVLPDF